MEFDDFDQDGLPSKTQRKKDAHAQQDLGKELTALPESTLAELPLSDPLRAAISEFKRIPHKRGAVKRQLQYIGRLIRDCDTELIRQQLDALHAPSPTPSTTPDLVQQYCDAILQSGDAGIQQVLEAETTIDRQQVRQLLRNYERANDDKKPAMRAKLLQYLRATCA